MGLESATYINGLVSTNPTAGDIASSGDDHLRLLKAALLATFPNITGAITPTHAELNFVDGVTSAIQTQLDLKAPLAAPAFTGNATGVNLDLSGTLDVAGVTTFDTYATIPTEAVASNNTRVASTEFVKNAVAAAVGGASRAEMLFYAGF